MTVGRMRISLAIRNLMVTSVRSRPANDGAFARDRPENRQCQPNWAVSFECLVREVAMKADRGSISRDGVHDEHCRNLRPSDAGRASMPEKKNGCDEPGIGAGRRKEHRKILWQRHALPPTLTGRAGAGRGSFLLCNRPFPGRRQKIHAVSFEEPSRGNLTAIERPMEQIVFEFFRTYRNFKAPFFLIGAISPARRVVNCLSG